MLVGKRYGGQWLTQPFLSANLRDERKFDTGINSQQWGFVKNTIQWSPSIMQDLYKKSYSDTTALNSEDNKLHLKS